MTVFPLIIDSHGSHLQAGGAAGSLLAAPFAGTTLLGRMAAGTYDCLQQNMTVLTTFPVDPEYESTIRQASRHIETVAPIQLWQEVLGGIEPSDWVLLIDPRTYPMEGLNLRRFLREAPQAWAARHMVALDRGEQGTKEYALLDSQGHLCRIRRYYEGITWLQASAVACSLISASCLRLIEDPGSLSLLQIRGQLASRGVPSQDILLQGDILDLNQEDQLLRLAEQSLIQMGNRRIPAGYRRVAPGVAAAPGCRIDPTARIQGPVLLQNRCQVKAGAILVGPTLVGPDSTIEEGACAAQCLLMRQSTIPAGQTVTHRVVCRRDAPAIAAPPVEPAEPAAPPSAWRPVRQLSRVIDEAMHQRWTYPMMKRAIDAIFALLALIILWPALAIVALLIKLDSRGPLLFGHEREGRHGEIFRCWKFRTMFHGAHAQQRALYRNSTVDGPQFKIDRDPRITRIGWLLRETNIDELPQLFNVLLGQMSLIGPRPSPFRENQICIPWRQARLSVRPGITGLWQICRNQRASGDFHQWIYYDMLYVRHMSLRLDLKILLATVLTMGGRWCVPVTWLIPLHRLYSETRPWRIPSLEEMLPDGAAEGNSETSASDARGIA